jgi:adenylate cyclase
MEVLKLRIMESDRLVFETAVTGPLELGRQRTNEPEPYSLVAGNGECLARLIVARQQENNCSRQHFQLEPLPDGRVRVTNRSAVPLLRPTPHAAIPTGGVVELAPPLSVLLDSRSIALTAGDSSDEPGLQSLSGHTALPGSLSDLPQIVWPLPTLNDLQVDELIGWLQTTMGVLQSTVGSADFLDKAAEALVQIVGLDSGRVLLLQGDIWSPVATFGTGRTERTKWRPSRHVLGRVRKEKRTFWQYPQQTVKVDSDSLLALRTVVASPLLGSDGQVIGALYGERRRDGAAPNQNNVKLEAILVEMLACGVSTGLARQEQQRAALRMSVQFEQFFTRELTQQLQQEPDLLEGREADVTLLFCDVRRFSQISETLGPGGTVRWICDVMSELSDRVLAEEGVLVDYIGDELMAMWGAPRAQPDQAIRSVLAALAMRDALGVLNQRWQETLGQPMDLGIGVNSGPARVGNTGSKHKFKYGPLGNTVNLAARVQGLTKYLHSRLLVTAATRKQLDERFIARRVCRARVVNIQEPVDLYEVALAGDEKKLALFRASESALEALEHREFAQAARGVGALIDEYPRDGPLLLVLARAAPMLMHPKGPFDPVWEPPGK